MQEQDTYLASEERGERRQRVLLRALISFRDEFAAIPCTVKDLSETGARMVLDGPALVPERFCLHVEVGGYKVDCERVWSHGLAMGVRFTGPRMHRKVHRDQHLQTSQDALSPETLRDMHARMERAAGMAARPSGDAGGTAARPTRPSFGRR